MRRLLIAVIAILCLGISGCAALSDWWPFSRGGAKNAGGTFKGVKQDWWMQAANIQVPKDMQDTSSSFD